jgi:hypothetical protein
MGITRQQKQFIKRKIEITTQKGNKFQKKILGDKDTDINVFSLNFPQSLFFYLLLTFKGDGICFEGGRGVGKTTSEGIAMAMIVETMPRSRWGIYAPSYQKFFSDEIPSIKVALEGFGLHENIHYFVKRKAPVSAVFDIPYQSPDDWKYCIHFYNGVVFQVLSEESLTVGVGLNLDGLIVIEAVYCNIDILERKVFPTVRGSNVRAFEDKCNLFGMKLFFSSTNVDNKGRWFTDMEQVTRMYKKKWQYIKAKTTSNLHNLKKGYLDDAEKTATNRTQFEAEYLCIRPPLVADAFFHAFKPNDVHGYRSECLPTTKLGNCLDDTDCDPNYRIAIGLDFGAVINSAVVSQPFTNELRILKDFFVLGANNENQDDLAHKVGKYYQAHAQKHVILYYDATGNNNTGNTKRTRAQQFADILKQYGLFCTFGTAASLNPDHEEIFLLFGNIMDENNTEYPNFRINIDNCPTLIVSIQNAPVKRSVTGKVQKDKSSEKRMGKNNRQFATDLSDALGYLGHGLYISTLKGRKRGMI